MADGIRVTDEAALPDFDAVSGDFEGSSGRVTRDTLGTSLLASGPLAERINQVESQVTSGEIAQSTWAALQALAPEADGTGGEVLDSDTGSHAQATATGYDGASVPNSGRYSYNLTWGRWVRIGDTGLSAKANDADLSPVATSGSYDDLTDTPTLGSAAAEDASAFATAAQGAKADTAVQPDGLSTAVAAEANRATAAEQALGDALNNLGSAADEDASAFATAAQGGMADTAVQPAALSAETTARQQGDNDLAARIDTIAIADVSRPGENPEQFSSTVTGDPTARTAITVGAPAVRADLGQVWRIAGADVAPELGYADVGPRRAYALEPDKIYRLRVKFARHVDPVDPSGNAVELRFQNLSASKAAVSQIVHGSPYNPVAGAAANEVTVFISRDAGAEGVDYVPPATARYFTPFLRLHGTGVQETDVALFEWKDVTDGVLGGADIVGLQSDLNAEQAARIAADADLAQTVAENEVESDAADALLQSELTTEVAARQAITEAAETTRTGAGVIIRDANGNEAASLPVNLRAEPLGALMDKADDLAESTGAETTRTAVGIALRDKDGGEIVSLPMGLRAERVAAVMGLGLPDLVPNLPVAGAVETTRTQVGQVITDAAGNVVATLPVGLEAETLQTLLDRVAELVALPERVAVSLDEAGTIREPTFAPWRLRETHVRLAQLDFGQSVTCVIAFIGDSFTENYARYAGPIMEKLWAEYGFGGCGWVGFGWFGSDANPPYDASGDGDQPAGLTAGITSGGPDVRVRLNGNWTCDYASPDHNTPALYVIESSETDAYVWIDVAKAGHTGARLFYSGDGTGVVQVSWDDGVSYSANIALDTVGAAYVDLTGVPATAFTARIKVISGNVTIAGLDLQADSGVRVHRLGVSGSRADQWAAVDGTRWGEQLAALGVNAASIMFGTNDQTIEVDPVALRLDMETIAKRVLAALPACDMLLCTPEENNRPDNKIAMSAYADQHRQSALVNGWAHMVFQDYFGPDDNFGAAYAYGSERPWISSDGIHPDPEFLVLPAALLSIIKPY